MRILLTSWLAILFAGPAIGAEPLRDQATKGLRKAVDYFRRHVAVEGGYLWRYSEDLSKREGEGKATATQAWVQPPGTPSVGVAYLTAFDATGDRAYLEAARETALALVRGQLRSGGWDYRIEFDPARRKDHAYRADSGDRGRNVSTYDDDTTQAALRLLMRVDRALGGKDKPIHDATLYGLEAVLKSQYPNGAWPQRYETFPDPAKYPVKKASPPATWTRDWPKPDYRGHYTLNDNVLADLVETLLEAERLHGGGKYRAAVEKAGGFLLLAQLPEPQPGWAQQYDLDMHPAWARKFEPPAVTGGESQSAMLTLLRLYQVTGDRKYLEPIPRALAYYRKSRLPDGRLARFYELKTNRPLYLTRDYRLTEKDDDLPTHYAFKVSSRLDRIAREYERLKALPPERLKAPEPPARPALTEAVAARAKAALAALDDRGRWVEDGRLRHHGADDATRRVLDCRTFARNVETLSAYLKAAGP